MPALHSVPPPYSLRLRRELRYNREQNALRHNFTQCERERSVDELKLLALERMKEELEKRELEHQNIVLQMRQRVSGCLETSDERSHEDLLQLRSLAEHRLAATTKEKGLISEEIMRLKSLSSQTNELKSDNTLHESRFDSNLILFLQKSTTKHPLITPLHPRSIDLLQVNDGQGNCYSVPSSSLMYHTNYHIRSHSVNGVSRKHTLNYEKGKGRAQGRMPQVIAPLCADEREDASQKSSLNAIANGNGNNHSFVLAVDEFTNSFSSRVIIPSKPRAMHGSSLRNLRTSTKPRRNLFKIVKSKSDNSEYGNVLIIGKTEPKSRDEFFDDLADVPLPAYVQNLLDDFEHSNSLSLTLGYRNPSLLDVLTFREPIPLSPVLEQSFSSSASTCPPIPSPIKSVEQKPLRKRRSIFTLRLPLRPSIPESNPRQSLEVSSSTSESDFIEVNYRSTPRIPVRRKLIGLPSTRNYDLSMLEKAPDDVPETPKTSNTRFDLPLTPSRIRASRGMSVLREVGNKFARLGRR